MGRGTPSDFRNLSEVLESDSASRFTLWPSCNRLEGWGFGPTYLCVRYARQPRGSGAGHPLCFVPRVSIDITQAVPTPHLSHARQYHLTWNSFATWDPRVPLVVFLGLFGTLGRCMCTHNRGSGATLTSTQGHVPSDNQSQRLNL